MNVSGEVLAFLVLSIGAISGGVLLIFLKKTVHSLLSVVLTFVSIAGLYILLTAEFVAGAQILIYSGAITIILLFAVMLTRREDDEKPERGKWWMRFVPLVAVLALGAIIFNGIQFVFGNESPGSFHVNNTEQIGIALFTRYIVPFELASILLLVALIGAIILARREEK